jgi:hypothetical protein
MFYAPYKLAILCLTEDTVRTSAPPLENISNGFIFEDFVSILTLGSMQNVTDARLQSTEYTQSGNGRFLAYNLS